MTDRKRDEGKGERKSWENVIPAIIVILGFFGINQIWDIGNLFSGCRTKEEAAPVIESKPSETSSSDSITVSSDESLLINRTIAESSGAEVVYGVSDALGQKHDAALKLSEWGGVSYATYYLGGEYTRFTGMLSAPEDTDSGPTYTFYAAVNNDPDQKVLIIEDMSRAHAPTPVEIDVTGCDYITFVSRMPDSGIIYTTGVLIYDGRLE